MRKSNALLIMITASILSLFSSCNSQNTTINIVHKNYTEQRLLGEILNQYLSSKGYDIEVKELDNTILCFNSIKSNKADIYFEYTGTIYASIFNETENIGFENTYNYVKERCKYEFDIILLGPLGFNNTYVFNVKKEFADKYNLKTISDLIPISDELILAGDQEFPVRDGDGYQAIKNSYGITFKEYKVMGQSEAIESLLNGKIDVSLNYFTDGRIEKYNLVSLIDDKNVFPPYSLTPIMNLNFFENNKKVVQALNLLEGKFSDKDMQKYNLMIEEGYSIKDTAEKMLKDKNLL